MSTHLQIHLHQDSLDRERSAEVTDQIGLSRAAPRESSQTFLGTISGPCTLFLLGKPDRYHRHAVQVLHGDSADNLLRTALTDPTWTEAYGWFHPQADLQGPQLQSWIDPTRVQKTRRLPDPAPTGRPRLARLLLEALGLRIFRSESSPPPEAQYGNLIFHYTGKRFHAQGHWVPEGHFRVLGGSTASPESAPTLGRREQQARETLRKQGILIPHEDRLRFQSYVDFSSPSTAAMTVSGFRANGRIVWKSPGGIVAGQAEPPTYQRNHHPALIVPDPEALKGNRNRTRP